MKRMRDISGRFPSGCIGFLFLPKFRILGWINNKRIERMKKERKESNHLKFLEAEALVKPIVKEHAHDRYEITEKEGSIGIGMSLRGAGKVRFSLRFDNLQEGLGNIAPTLESLKDLKSNPIFKYMSVKRMHSPFPKDWLHGDEPTP